MTWANNCSMRGCKVNFPAGLEKSCSSFISRKNTRQHEKSTMYDFCLTIPVRPCALYTHPEKDTGIPRDARARGRQFNALLAA